MKCAAPTGVLSVSANFKFKDHDAYRTSLWYSSVQLYNLNVVHLSQFAVGMASRLGD
jgi:hypothetical protein